MAQLNLSLPSFQGLDLSDEKQLRKLTSYLYRLDEQLRYVLNNLGEENLSDSLRAIINAQTDATVLDEMTGQVQRLSTQIVQTAQAISLKADKETLDALGETLGSSIAALEVTAEQIRAEVSNTASGLQSQINQQAGQITLSVQTATNAQNTANSAAGAAAAANAALGEKLGKKEAAAGVNTGSGILINQNGVYVEGKEIDLRTSDGDEYVHISEAGVSASSIDAPNVAAKYDGGTWIGVNPQYTASEIAWGNRYRSLNEAFNALKNKVIDEYITISVVSGALLYETAVLQGARFLSGCTITTSDDPATATINGGIEILHCSGYIKIQRLKIYPADGQSAIKAYGKSQFIHMLYCNLYGRAKTTGVFAFGGEISDGTSCQVEFCEFYNFSYAMEVASMASLNVQSGNKGNCNLRVRGGFMFVTGKAPSENGSDWKYTYNGPYFCSAINVTTDQGSAGGGSSAPTIETAAYSASTASYKGSGSKYRDDLVQGWYSGIGRIRGCMWFYNAGIRDQLRGKTVLSATLQLTMRSNVGRGVGVTVELSGTSANSGASSVAVTTNYGVLGTANPGETVTFTLPTAAVTDLVNGTINGLMLYSSDTGAYKERSYSKNYAVFDGAADATPPQLTVIYQ